MQLISEEMELEDMGSMNHSYIQANLTWIFKNIQKYSVFTELSLEINQVELSNFNIKAKEELKPDVCIYPKIKINYFQDNLKAKEPPLSVIEILSPRQYIDDILEKFKVYFVMGVKSCWLVVPATQSITVYNSLEKSKTFSENKVIDEILNFHVPIRDIFD